MVTKLCDTTLAMSHMFHDIANKCKIALNKYRTRQGTAQQQQMKTVTATATATATSKP